MKTTQLVKNPPAITFKGKPRSKSPVRLQIENMEIGQCIEISFSVSELKEKSLRKRYLNMVQLLQNLKKLVTDKGYTLRSTKNGFDIFCIAKKP